MPECKNCTNCFYPNSEYISWLLKVLSPVIFGEKPSEIISIPKPNSSATNNSLDEIKSFFSHCKKIKFKIINFNNYSYKVFFYHPQKLKDTLNNKSNKLFLKKLNYDINSYNNMLNDLFKKISNGVIPDEIGIFLGYPLKDVLGFMGHPSLKHTKTRGWRIYGDSRVSDKLYSNILSSKEKMLMILESTTINSVFEKYIQ